MIGHLVACHGAADRYLGMLAATLGEWERAEEHFERAMELNRRMGAATWLAHTAYEHARMLLARGPGERDRVGALLGEAAALAERVGCRRCSVAYGPSAPRRRPSAIPTSCPRARSRSCASSPGA